MEKANDPFGEVVTRAPWCAASNESNMAAMDVRLFGLYEAKFRTDPSGVGTPLFQLGEVVRPRLVVASEVAKMAAPRGRRHPGPVEPR